MKKIIARAAASAMLLASAVILFSGCSAQSGSSSETASAILSLASSKASYTQISQDEAKKMMQRNDGHIIVDVRRQDEYDEGHIEGAILIPNESIEDERPKELGDHDQVILIYCRSGRRSKEAAQKLADMGYGNIYEFGGINTWTGKIVS